MWTGLLSLRDTHTWSSSELTSGTCIGVVTKAALDLDLWQGVVIVGRAYLILFI